jgi:molecular chaperone GrpE (heat shock protein)
MAQFTKPAACAVAAIALLVSIGAATSSPAASLDRAGLSAAEASSSRIILAQATTTPAPATETPSTQAPAAAAPSGTTVMPANTRIEARIKELHAKLKITKDQEDKWKDVTDVMRENADKMEQLVKARSEGAAKMSAIDDLNSYSQIADAHAEGLKKFITAFQALYDSMSDAQKKNADTLFHARIRARAKKTAG